MSKMTFVVEFPDGQEPVISAATDILGGKLLSAAFKDATQGIDSLVRAAMLARSCGTHWSKILSRIISEEGWNYIEIGDYSAVVSVPAEDVDVARKLVDSLVPAIMDVKVQSI